MSNTAIEIPFYVSKDGEPLTDAAAQIGFESLKTLSGSDKSGDAPTISEIGGGWYKFSVAYGTAPFDAGDLIAVLDVDKNGNNNLANAERYIPVEVRLDFYALMRLVNNMSQNKSTQAIWKLRMLVAIRSCGLVLQTARARWIESREDRKVYFFVTF